MNGRGRPDAIINASVTIRLHGFVPIFDVLSFTCTPLQGSAVRIASPR